MIITYVCLKCGKIFNHQKQVDNCIKCSKCDNSKYVVSEDHPFAKDVIYNDKSRN